MGGAAALSACSSSDSGTTGGTAGSTTGTAGKSGTGGSGNGTAGTGTGTAGTGVGTAGTGTGTAGSGTGTAGSGAGGAGAGFACVGTMPTGALITSFNDLVKSTDATTPNEFTLGGTEGLPGGTFSYQKGALTYTTDAKSLEVKGNVKDYDGFGLYFSKCIDASAYKGVSFNVKGNAGPSGKILFSFQTNADTGVNPTTMKGSCPVSAGKDPNNDDPECHFAQYSVTVPTGGGVVTVNFADTPSRAGLPVAGVDGKDLLGIQWGFSWAGMTDTPYDVDLTVDDVMFVGGSSGGAGGAGGTGAGGASGGSAGAATGGGGAGGAAAGTGGASGGAGGTGGAH